MCLSRLPSPPKDEEPLVRRQLAFGYTYEDLNLILAPMAQKASSRSVRWATTRRWRCCPTGRSCSTATSSSSSPR